MTESDPGPQDGGAPPRLTRSRTDRVLGGVCGGLGHYFGTEAIWFRLGFVVFTLAGGSGLLAYIVAWVIIPENKGDEPESASTVRAVGPEGAVIVGIVLVGVGLVLLLNQFVPMFSRVMWPMAVVAGGLALIFMGMRRDRT